MFKRTVSLLTALVLLLFCFANASAEGFTDPVHQIEMKTVPIYLGSPDLKDSFTLYFVDGVQDLPFVDLPDWVEVLNSLLPEPTGKFEGFQVTAQVSEDEKMVILKRENGQEMAVDFENR